MRVNTIVIPEKLSQSCTPRNKYDHLSFSGTFSDWESNSNKSSFFFRFAGRLPGNLVHLSSTRNFRTWAKHFPALLQDPSTSKWRENPTVLAKKNPQSSSLFHRSNSARSALRPRHEKNMRIGDENPLVWWKLCLAIWVCLKMVSTPKPNGFADHYPVFKWL